MNESIWQSQTFKSLVLYVCVLVANAVARKWGVSLDASELAGFTVALVAFIAGRQFKQAKMLEQEIHPMQVAASENAKPATDAPIASTTSVFKTLVPLVLVCSMLLPGCAWWKAHPTFQTALKECGSRLVSAEVTGLLPDVQAAMTGQPADWQGQLDQLVLRGGEAAICAIAAFVQALQSGQGGSEVNPVEVYERAQRAAYLEQYLRGVSR